MATSIQQRESYDLSILFNLEMKGRVDWFTSPWYFMTNVLDVAHYIENGIEDDERIHGWEANFLERAEQMRNAEEDCVFIYEEFIEFLAVMRDVLSPEQQKRAEFLGLLVDQ